MNQSFVVPLRHLGSSSQQRCGTPCHMSYCLRVWFSQNGIDAQVRNRAGGRGSNCFVRGCVEINIQIMRLLVPSKHAWQWAAALASPQVASEHQPTLPFVVEFAKRRLISVSPANILGALTGTSQMKAGSNICRPTKSERHAKTTDNKMTGQLAGFDASRPPSPGANPPRGLKVWFGWLAEGVKSVG